MKNWIREPLLHFFLAGALLFGAYAWLNRGGGDAPRAVRITAAEVNWLKETWTRQWQRLPSEEELRGLVSDYLKEELLAREARELGLDEDDIIVRRRLAQKMEFLVQDTARIAEPGEEALRQFYDARRTQYQAPARVSFTQLYFRTEAAARRALEELKTRSPAGLGDPSMLPREGTGADEQAVASQFGPAFAARVFAHPPARWMGPVASSYGFHLVWISEQQAAQARPFDQVRAQVLEEWHRVQQAKTRELYFAGLLKKYEVVVEDSLKPLIGPLSEATP
jgi:parvulin-like peptidyl-prolyl isomerase